MRGQYEDHATRGDFIEAADGWHIVEVQEGVAYLHKKGEESVLYQDKDGFSTIKFPTQIVDDQDESNGSFLNHLVKQKSNPQGTSASEKWIGALLIATELWDAVCKKFPGDVSVVDDPVVEGMKIHLLGKPFMARSEQDKEGKAQLREIMSIKSYQEILKANGGKFPEVTKGKGGKGKKDTAKTIQASPATNASPTPTTSSDGW